MHINDTLSVVQFLFPLHSMLQRDQRCHQAVGAFHYQTIVAGTLGTTLQRHWRITYSLDLVLTENPFGTLLFISKYCAVSILIQTIILLEIIGFKIYELLLLTNYFYLQNYHFYFFLFHLYSSLFRL